MEEKSGLRQANQRHWTVIHCNPGQGITDTLAGLNQRRLPKSKTISRALNASPTAIENVSVDHRRAHVGVPQQLLHRANVVAVFHEMSREGMAQSVAAGGLGDARLDAGFFERSLEDGFMEVVAPPLAGLAVGVMAGGGEDPLPAPLLIGVGILADESVRQFDTAQTAFKILAVLAFDESEMRAQRLPEC